MFPGNGKKQIKNPVNTALCFLLLKYVKVIHFQASDGRVYKHQVPNNLHFEIFLHFFRSRARFLDAGKTVSDKNEPKNDLSFPFACNPTAEKW